MESSDILLLNCVNCFNDVVKKPVSVVCVLCRGQVQWMYQSDDTFEPYPADINIMIEKNYREKKQSASWQENDGRFEVDFVRMVEEKVGSAGTTVRVKRDTTGLF